MKIFITGATGFIGSNIAKRCLSEKHTVYLSVRKTSNLWRINDIMDVENLKLCDCDLESKNNIDKILSEILPDAIIHCASYGGAQAKEMDIVKIINANCLMTALLADSASKYSKLFINTGSSSEYGLYDRPTSEEDILQPVNLYGASKAGATLLAHAMAKAKGLEITTLRIYSAYGPYESKTRFIPIAISKAKKNETIKVVNAVRDYIHVDDICDAYIAAIYAGRGLGMLNLANGKQHTLQEIALKIINILNSNSSIEVGAISAVQAEPTCWQGDINRIKKSTGWAPKYSLNDGLMQTIDWFEKNEDKY